MSIGEPGFCLDINPEDCLLLSELDLWIFSLECEGSKGGGWGMETDE